MKKILLTTTMLSVLSTATLAADLRPVLKAPVMAVPEFSWTGFYLGISGGSAYSTGNLNWGKAFSNTPGQVDCMGGGATAVPCTSVPQSGWIVGGTAGFNWQSGAVVYGVEATLSGQFGLNRSLNYYNDTLNAIGTAETKASFEIRSRTGLAFQNTLAYVTGGFAWLRQDVSITGDYAAGPTTEWVPALVVGAGIEHAITNNLTIKGEALYYAAKDGSRVKDCTYSGDCSYGKTFKANPSQWVARIGINYLFNGH